MNNISLSFVLDKTASISIGTMDVLRVSDMKFIGLFYIQIRDNLRTELDRGLKGTY